MKKYNHGFVLGKFMPLHSGHIFLLETAKKQCNKLTILLCAQPDDPIPGAIRLKWLKKQFPNADVVLDPDALPRDQTNPHFWDLWRISIRKYCTEQKFDVVFTSEKYGPRLAKKLNSKHIEIDLDRTHFPVSGTDIRNDPRAFAKYIPDVVKPYYKNELE